MLMVGAGFATIGSAAPAGGEVVHLKDTCSQLKSDAPSPLERQRQTMGLPLDSALDLELLNERNEIPVSDEELERIDRVATLRDSMPANELRDVALRSLGSSFIGISWEAATGWVVYVTDSTSIGGELGLDDSEYRLEVVPGGVAASEYLDSLAFAASIQPDLSELGVDGFGLDERCGLIEFRYRPGSDVKAIRQVLDSEIEPSAYWLREATAQDRTQVMQRGTSDPQWVGGKRVQVGNNNSTCTGNLGFYKDTSAGREWWGLTAAHCLPDQPGYVSGSFATTTEVWRQAGQDVGIVPGGTTTYYAYGNGIDIAVTQIDRDAAARTYITDSTNPDTFQTFVWWQWSSSLDAVGDRVCTAGQATNALSCGDLEKRNDFYTLPASESGIGRTIFMTDVRLVENTTRAVNNGDSGGATWHRQSSTSHNLAGVLHASRGSSKFLYSHISFALSTFGLVSVVECNSLGTC